MSVQMDLEFEKYCKVDQSPRTVLPSPRIPKHENRTRRGKPRFNEESLGSGFREIKLRNYHRSISCKSLPTRNSELSVDSAVLKRGSVYHSSKERQSFQRRDSVGGRKKIEVSLDGGSSFSFSLLDSICGSDDEEEESVSLKLDHRESAAIDQMESPKLNYHLFRKSLASKLAFSQSPAHSLDSYGSKGSPKSRFMPIRKMFDPLTKSKPRRSSMIKSSDPMITEKSKNLQYVKKDLHLHGDLKLQYKHGVPYFELTFSHSEDIFVAKTWKSEDTLDWVYTFHSIQGRKNSPIIGQMQVSSHLVSDLKDVHFSSMVTEFVLYDIMQARKSVPADAFSLDFSSPYPWAPTDLHPVLESAAVVIEVPIGKRESLKYKSGDIFSHVTEQMEKDSIESRGTRVNVVTPVGSHTLPDSETRGPLPLLDRWRVGGGCDCGGWDLACPIVVLASPSNACEEDDPNSQDGQPFELFVQGPREKTPALTIQLTRKGNYAVHFHERLSPLQAFAISVAMLHTTETSTTTNEENHKPMIQALTEKKKIERHPSSFALNPPFSPIARV